jgi:hypothetical protein
VLDRKDIARGHFRERREVADAALAIFRRRSADLDQWTSAFVSSVTTFVVGQYAAGEVVSASAHFTGRWLMSGGWAPVGWNAARKLACRFDQASAWSTRRFPLPSPVSVSRELNAFSVLRRCTSAGRGQGHLHGTRRDQGHLHSTRRDQGHLHSTGHPIGHEHALSASTAEAEQHPASARPWHGLLRNAALQLDSLAPREPCALVTDIEEAQQQV